MEIRGIKKEEPLREAYDSSLKGGVRDQKSVL